MYFFAELTSTMASDTNSQKLPGLGSLDFSSISKAIANSSGSKRKSYQKWTDRQRFQIGKYVAENAPGATAKKFTSEMSPLKKAPFEDLEIFTKRKLNKLPKKNGK